jgi:predicted Zn-dependent protease
MTAAYSHSIELSLLKQQEAARGFLSIGDAGEAEAEIRQSLSSGFVTAESYAILAEALADQGKLDAATDAILLAIESAQGVERYRSLFARIDNEKKRGYSPKL